MPSSFWYSLEACSLPGFEIYKGPTPWGRESSPASETCLAVTDSTQTVEPLQVPVDTLMARPSGLSAVDRHNHTRTGSVVIALHSQCQQIICATFASWIGACHYFEAPSVLTVVPRTNVVPFDRYICYTQTGFVCLSSFTGPLILPRPRPTTLELAMPSIRCKPFACKRQRQPIRAFLSKVQWPTAPSHIDS